MTIYKITNTTNGKTYIGSTLSFAMRKADHKYHLKKDIHTNRLITADYKLGHSFIFEPIEQNISLEHLKKIEKVWIKFLQPEYNTYGTNKKRAK